MDLHTIPSKPDVPDNYKEYIHDATFTARSYLTQEGKIVLGFEGRGSETNELNEWDVEFDIYDFLDWMNKHKLEELAKKPIMSLADPHKNK